MTNTARRLTLGLGIALLALGVSAAAYAAVQNTNQGGRPFRGGRGPGGPGRFAGPDGPMGMLPPLPPFLNLTDAQKDQIKAIASSHTDEWKSLADRARTAHEALMTAEMIDPIDDGVIRQKSAEVASVEADMAVSRAHARAEVFQVLTSDQKAQIKQMREQMGGRRGQRGR
jgi:Spy/CpxP family protein refolding chaperone